ncbi:MAG TPA: transketolase [Bacteroidales bacterium]|nr:transketolase [Bacteroidales bacterium]
MPIINSKTLKVVKDYSVEELIQKAKEMRVYNMVSLSAAGSGHTGGTLSIMDVAAVLYLKVINHDPANPKWDDRDRVFWSVGHKAPALYVALGMAGYYPIEDTVKLRKLWSGFDGHPNQFKLPGLELSSGSLGQGFGVAIGSALRAKLDKKDYRVFCIMGDGEQQEGSIWEGVMSAGHYHLDNLVGIIDLNGLQIDGKTEAVMNIEPIEDKYRAFGWGVIHTDGNDIKKLIETFTLAEKVKNKPVVILAHTVKGKGVSYAEDVTGYHGIPPKDGRYGNESLDRAVKDILGESNTFFTKEKIDSLLNIADEYQGEVDKKLISLMPVFKQGYWWNKTEMMKVTMDPTRMGFGKALGRIGEDKSTVAFGADITSSIKMDGFYKDHPERKERFYSIGIAEQNMTLVAAGFAKEGKKSFIGSYGVFVSGRNWDQIRTTCCYNNFNVKIAGAHGGISVGADGATHQALEEIPLMYYLPNMHIEVPCDSIETEKSTFAIKEVDGPGYIRYGREATAVVTRPDTVFKFGVANIIRFRKVQSNFIDAFDIVLSTKYKNEKEDICIVACGTMVAEAMRAAWILKQEYNIETRVVNIHTVKPIDKGSLLKATEEIGKILTIEEQQVGGFGNIVAGVIAQGKRFSKSFAMDMVGINDHFGESGAPWDLMKAFGLSAEQITVRAKKLFDIK